MLLAVASSTYGSWYKQPGFRVLSPALVYDGIRVVLEDVAELGRQALFVVWLLADLLYRLFLPWNLSPV